MADSSSNLDFVIQSQASKEVTINALADAGSPATVYGRRQFSTSGLTWGYYGGRWGGFSIANGTQLLGASTTTYMVVLKSTGVVSFSTATTNWNDATNYARAYKIVTNTTAIASYEDHRAGSGGVMGGGSGGGMTNPMTAVGDLIVGGTSGTPARLAKGTDGQVLTLVSGAPAWAAGGGGGGSGGDMLSTLLSAEVSIIAAATLTSSAFGKMHVCSGTTADYTVGLPAVAGNAGKIIGFRMAPALTKLVTLDANASEQIDGALTRVMWANEVAILICDGTAWTKIAGKTIPMACVLRASTTEPMLSATLTKLPLGTVLSDVGGITDAANKRAVLRREGNYHVTAQGYFDPGGAAKRVIANLYLDGSPLVSAEANTQALPSFASPTVVAGRLFAAGSIFELYGYHDSGITGSAISGVSAASVLRITEEPTW